MPDPQKRYTVQEAQAIVLGLYDPNTTSVDLSTGAPTAVSNVTTDLNTVDFSAQAKQKPQRPPDPNAPQRIGPMSILNAPSSATGATLSALRQQPGQVIPALAAGAQELGRALTVPVEQQTSPSQELDKAGVQLPGLLKFIVDAGLDPTNLIPGPREAAAVGAAGLATPGLVKRIAGLFQRAGASLPPSVIEEAAIQGPRQIRRVPGLGAMLDQAAGREALDLSPQGIRSLPQDTATFGAFTDRIALGSPEDRALAQDIFARNQHFAESRRMGQANAQTVRKAEDLVVELHGKPLPKGTALNAEQTVALNSAAEGALGRATELGKQIDTLKAANQAIPQTLQAEQMLAAQEAVIAVQSVAGARSEAGRALQIYKQMQRERNALGDVAFVEKALKTGSSQLEIANALTTLPDDLSRYRFLRDAAKPKFQDWWQWYYVTNLLSAPVTHIRNVVGNTTRTVMAIAEPLADLQVRETVTGAAGAIHGLKQGWKKAAFAFREGFSPDDVAGLVERPAEVSIAGNRQLPNVIGRGLEASDQFFRTVAAETAASQGAFRRAKASGLKPGTAAFDAKVAELLANRPTDLIAEMATAGGEAVFRQKADGVTTAIQGFRKGLNNVTAELGHTLANGTESWLGPKAANVVGFLASVPMGTFLLPFITTPANILRAGARFSPLGFAEAGLAAMKGADPVQVMRMRRQAQIGSALLIYPAILAWEGKLTGSGPSDPNERSLWLAEGKIPNAVKIGDHWVQYNQFQPIAPAMSLIANAYEMHRATGEPPGVGGLVFKLGNSLLQQSYLQGMFNLVQAIEEPDRFADKFIGRTASGLIPASSMVRNVNQSFVDPTLRDAQGVTENALQGVPGYSQTIPPKVDREGQPIQGDSGLQRFLVPFRISEDKSGDPLYQALHRTDLTLSVPSSQIKDAAGQPLLTRQQGSRLEMAMGKAQSAAIRGVTSQPGFERLPIEEQRKQIEQAQNTARSQVRQIVRAVAELKRAAAQR